MYKIKAIKNSIEMFQFNLRGLNEDFQKLHTMINDETSRDYINEWKTNGRVYYNEKRYYENNMKGHKKPLTDHETFNKILELMRNNRNAIQFNEDRLREINDK